MTTSFLRPHIYIPTFTSFKNSPNFPRFTPPRPSSPPLKQSLKLSLDRNPSDFRPILTGNSRFLVAGAVTVGVILLITAWDGQTALALGPEGPLVEEFWENIRRYGLYALTVSTGAIYTILQPMLELLKNPISAILLLVILGGGFFIVSQVISAMVGVSDFSYDYGY